MEKEQGAGREAAPKPPIAGVIYGTICFWIVMLGIAVAIAGMIMYFVSDTQVSQECLLDTLWEGATVEEIWHECAGVDEVPTGHWWLKCLSEGYCIAMLGIAICAWAAVIGMWGAVWGTVRSGERLYVVFALIIAVILTLAAIGVISLE